MREFVISLIGCLLGSTAITFTIIIVDIKPKGEEALLTLILIAVCLIGVILSIKKNQ